MQEDYTAEIKSDNKIVSGIYEILESLVFAIAFVILIFVFIAKLSIVSGDSMNNTLENADYLIVANLSCIDFLFSWLFSILFSKKYI